jgi:hypothetical protein
MARPVAVVKPKKRVLEEDEFLVGSVKLLCAPYA